MKKNNFLSFIVLFVFAVIWFVGFLFVKWFFLKEETTQKNVGKLQNLSFLKNYLQENYDWEYPYPKGDVKLLDENLERIHLEDKNKDFKEIKDLYVLQWTTCWLNIEDKKFQKNVYDEEFSTWANKKCYSYSVTKDHQNFQIWAVLKAKEDLSTQYAYLTWNIWKSITKSYNWNKKVFHEKKNLPYMPIKNYKISIALKKWKPDYSLKENNEKLEKNLENAVYLPSSNKSSDIKLEAEWENFLFEVVYPNGNKQLLSPNENGKAVLEIKDFKYDGVNTEVGLFNTLWKVAYNMISVGDSSKYNIHDSQWGALVIRGTKFTLDLDKDWSSSFLLEWKIDYKKDNKSYSIKEDANVIGFEDWKKVDIFDFSNKLKSMYSYWVFMDTYMEPKNSFDIKKTDQKLEWTAYELLLKANTEKLKNDEVYELINQNWKKFHLIKFDWFFDFDNSGWKLKDFYSNHLDYFKEIFLQRTSDETFFERFEDREDLKNAIKDYWDTNYYFYQNYDNICKQNWFEGYVKLNDAYRFLFNKNYSSESITFWLNQYLESVLKETYAIVFGNKTDENLWITYFDTKTGSLNYKSSPKTNKGSQKRDGVVLLCR